MKLKKIILFLILLLVNFSFTLAALPAHNGFITDWEAGYAWLQTPNKIFPHGMPPKSYSVGDFSWGLDVGYNFAIKNHWLLGPLFGYHDYGASKYPIVTEAGKVNMGISSETWDLSAAARYIWSNGINVFSKLGGAQVTQIHFGSPFNIRKTDYRPVAAVGSGYIFNFGLGINLEYQHLFAKNQDDWDKVYDRLPPGSFKGVANVNAIYVDLFYLFG